MPLAERVGAPVGHSLGGKEWIQYDNPYDVGMSGLLGYGACYDAMHEAELVILLGTEFTMVGDFLSGPLRADGISVAVPNAEEIAYIQDKIATELEFGVVRDDTREGFCDIIRRLAADDGGELVILGCTELPLLLDDSTSPVPTLDTMDPHIDDLVRVALGEELG